MFCNFISFRLWGSFPRRPEDRAPQDCRYSLLFNISVWIDGTVLSSNSSAGLCLLQRKWMRSFAFYGAAHWIWNWFGSLASTYPEHLGGTGCDPGVVFAGKTELASMKSCVLHHYHSVDAATSLKTDSVVGRLSLVYWHLYQPWLHQNGNYVCHRLHCWNFMMCRHFPKEPVLQVSQDSSI